MAITKYPVLVIMLLVACFISCNKNKIKLQNPVQDVRVFQVDSGGSNNQGIVKLSDDNFLIYGCLSISNLNRYVFIKYSPDGKIIWQQILPIQDQIFIYKVLPLPNKEFVTVGTDEIKGTINIVFYNESGNMRLPPIEDYTDAAEHELAAMIDRDGNIIITGSKNKNLYFFRFPSNGGPSTTKTTFQSSFGNTSTLNITEDEISGEYYVLSRYKKDADYNIFLTKFDSAGGNKWISKIQDNLNCVPACCIFKDDSIHGFYTPGTGNNLRIGIHYPVFSGDLHHQVWDSEGDSISNEVIKGLDGMPSNCVFTSLTKTEDSGCLFAGTYGFYGGDFVSPSRVILVKLGPDFKLEWWKKFETAVPSLGIDAVELNGSYYVSGTALFADSVAFMMLLKTPVE